MGKGLTAIVAAGLITLGGITAYSQKSIDTTIDTIQAQTSIKDTLSTKQDTLYSQKNYEGDFNGDGKTEKLKIVKGGIDVERIGGPAGTYNIVRISIIKERNKDYIRLEYLDEDMKKKFVKIEYYDGVNPVWVITPTR